MFTIEWDKREVREIVERISRLYHQHHDCFNLSTSVYVLVNGVDISGCTERQNCIYTRLMDVFLGAFSVFRSIDPERLGDKPFHLTYNLENCVLGKGFRYFVQYDKMTDLVTFDYIYTGKKEFQSVSIPLRDFATGVILSAEEMIGEILSISKECRDASYRIFRADLDIIKDWYQEVYGEDTSKQIVVKPSLNRQNINETAIVHPGMIQIVWNRNELEDRTRNVVSKLRYNPHLTFEMGFHLFIADIDIIGGAYTMFDSLFFFIFSDLYWIIKEMNPEYLDPEEMNYLTDGPEGVSGPGFEFTITLQDNKTLLFDYQSGAMIDHAQTTAPLREFVETFVQADEEYLREALNVWPELGSSDFYLRKVTDISILRKWYERRYGVLIS
ncbi:hypothetical protein L1S32_00190 [Methanogenium sp. S4BF]|uniref:hypothetical protein n=1 Tax=Methanogenium sp. S4BF TaxID=1789226 RepID=UPI00241647BA|nr:hypothetical protein [Methanogenium sp. S4BF]WFN34576.1 hypothetical protein L1S32_00190 [Methanogenium sp. S4BF]